MIILLMDIGYLPIHVRNPCSSSYLPNAFGARNFFKVLAHFNTIVVYWALTPRPTGHTVVNNVHKPRAYRLFDTHTHSTLLGSWTQGSQAGMSSQCSLIRIVS